MREDTALKMVLGRLTRIEQKIDKLTSSGMSAAEVAAVVARLQSHDAALQAMTSDSASVPERRMSMSVPQSLTDALAKIDADTDALAAVVTDLRSKVKVGMTQADVDAVDAKLAAVAARLEGIAVDPNVPVPPGPPPSP